MYSVNKSETVVQSGIKKETLAQVFSCEYCEISKNTFFHRTPLIAASMIYVNLLGRSIIIQNLVISNSKCGHHFSMDAQLKTYGNKTEATAVYNDKWGQREKIVKSFLIRSYDDLDVNL